MLWERGAYDDEVVKAVVDTKEVGDTDDVAKDLLVLLGDVTFNKNGYPDTSVDEDRVVLSIIKV